MRSIVLTLCGVFIFSLIGCAPEKPDPAGMQETRPDYYDRRPVYENQQDNNRHFETTDR
jgi:hypothetical protein